MSRIFDVPVAYFFEEMSPKTAATTSFTKPSQRLADEQAALERDPLAKHETLELVRAYYRITDPLLRKRVFEMTKVLGKTVRER